MLKVVPLNESNKFGAFPNPWKNKSNILFFSIHLFLHASWFYYRKQAHSNIWYICFIFCLSAVALFLSTFSNTHFCWLIIIIFKLHMKHSPPPLSLQGHDIPPSFPPPTNAEWDIKIAEPKLRQEKPGVIIKHFTFLHFPKFGFANTPTLQFTDEVVAMERRWYQQK